MAQKRVRVRVFGRVQGVFFRANTHEMASGLGLDGWVRNMYDGSVEALFEGEEGTVERAVLWCREGPPHARVDDIKIHTETPTGDLGAFCIQYY